MNKKALGPIYTVAILIICIGIFMYLGSNYAMGDRLASETALRFKGDFFDLFLEDKDAFNQDLDAYVDSLESGENYTAGYSTQLNENFSSMPGQVAGQQDSSSSLFLDGLRIIWALIATILNLAFVPITIMSIGGMSPLIAIMIGFPLSFLMFLAVLMTIRGLG